MRKNWLLSVLLGGLAWGQAAPAAQQTPVGAPKPAQPQAASPDKSATVADDAAVITVKGVCPATPKPAAAAKPASTGATAKPETGKTPAGDCKTIVTKAEFEKLVASVPNSTPQMKRQIAGLLPRLIAMSEAAKKRGLDKTPQFKELLKVQTMQILSNELTRNVQAEAAKVPESEVESYYKANPEAFEQFNLERLFVPRTRQIESDAKDDDDDKNTKLTDEQQKAKEEAEKAKAAEGEQAMAKLAEALRVRAAAGEDFVKLQKEAFEAAGMKIESPTVTLPKVRRTGLPVAHAAVFELKVGEVSSVINDSGGHYLYKVTGKDTIPYDQAKEEIRGKMQNDRAREMMEKLNSSFSVETNEAYFGPGAVNPAPPPRMGGPRMAPSPMAPSARPQTPPPPQAPANPPAAKQD